MMVAIPFIAFPQFNIIGKITNKNNGETLPFANIMVENSFKGTYSSQDGSYNLPLVKKGKQVISYSYMGFQTVSDTIYLRKDTIINLALLPISFTTEDVTITASTSHASQNEAVTFTNIKPFESIDKINVGQDLPYLISQTPSVVVTSDAGTGVGYTGIHIRGTDPTRINVTVNGIPTNDAESAATYWVDLPDIVSSVDQIQIQRGVGSSTNGAGAFGASINMQTSSLSQKPYAETNSSYGSFNTSKNSVSVGTGLLDKHWNIDARLSKIYSDGYIDRAFSNLKSYYFSAGYSAKNDQIKFITFSGTEKTYQAWYGVPQDSLKTNRTYNPYTYSNQTDNYIQDNYQLLYSHAFSQKLMAHAALHYTYGRGYYEEFCKGENFAAYGLVYPVIGTDTIFTTDLIRQRWLDNDFYGATWSLKYDDYKKLQWTFGGGYNQYTGRHFGEIIWAQYASNSFINAHYYNNTGYKSDFNVFGKALYNITNRIIFFADLQYRIVNYNFKGFDEDRRVFDNTVNLPFFNPKAGFIMEVNDNNNIYTSFSIGNKEPNRDDYVQAPPDSLPRPESMQDVELGYRHKSGKLAYTANLYYMNYKDQLVLTGKINDVGSYNRINIDKSYRSGIEASVVYKPIDKLTIDVNATYSKNKIKKFTEYIDNWDTWGQEAVNHQKTDIAFSPSVIANGLVEYEIMKKLTMGWNCKYTGMQYMDNTSNKDRSIDAYLVNDLRFNYVIKPKFVNEIAFSFMINNILNSMYVSNGWTYTYLTGGNYYTDNYYFPQAGRNVMMGIKVKFL